MESPWSQLTRNILNCQRCKAIANARNRPVPGLGSVKAKIIIIGLAPGRNGADLTGIPFTRDPSGELFDQMLSVAGLSRNQDVFVTNLVKCNPKDADGLNRTPSKEEIGNCLPYLRSEIEYLKPRIIVTFGRSATEILLGEKIRNMKESHGVKRFKDEMLVYPFLHPSYVIRGAYDKKKYLAEFEVVGSILRELINEEARLSRLDILLLLLKNSSEGGVEGRLRGKTRLQKLLFLAQKKLSDEGYKARYAFRPYLYGPYSRELYTDLEWLRMNGLIDVCTPFDEKAGLMTDFIITEDGKKRLANLMNSGAHMNVDITIRNVINKYAQMSVAQLVEFVHAEFSNYNLSHLEGSKKQINMRLDRFVHDKSISHDDNKRVVEKEL